MAGRPAVSGFKIDKAANPHLACMFAPAQPSSGGELCCRSVGTGSTSLIRPSYGVMTDSSHNAAPGFSGRFLLHRIKWKLIDTGSQMDPAAA